MPVDQGHGLLGLADLEPFPHADGPLGRPDGDDVRRGDEDGGVGHLDRGGVRAVELGTAVDDDDLVPAAQGADDLSGGAVGDLLAALALRRGEEQGEAGLVDVHGVLEDARRDVGDGGEVGDGSPELDVQVGGDVAALEVHVDERDGAP